MFCQHQVGGDERLKTAEAIVVDILKGFEDHYTPVEVNDLLCADLVGPASCSSKARVAVRLVATA